MHLNDKLATLLAERRLLRQLSNDLTRWKLLGEREKADKIKQKIAGLVKEPLPTYSPRESLPAAQFLAEAVQNLLCSLNDLRFSDNPASYWDRYNPLPGVGLNWPQPLRDRLIALCGPLDATLSEMLEAA